VKERVLQRLTQLPDGQALCHGDFHPGNVLMTASGPVVIDWMTATAGHPLADVARTTLMFRTARVPSDYDASMRLVFQQVRDGFYATYLHCYREQRPFPLAEMEAWIPVLAAARLNEGIADEREALLRLVGEA
jgi:aminoglycoside phosphotransferase (APT) family kinase protein